MFSAIPLVTLCITSTFAIRVDVSKTDPVYKYQYQTEESMKTSSSEYPFQSYLPPYPVGYYNNFQRGPTTGYYQPRFAGYNPYFVPQFHPYHHRGYGGEVIDKKSYNNEDKKAGGESFEKAEGSRGESGQHGSEGFSQGQIAVKDAKGDSGYYKNQEGEKKGFNDGRFYQGGQQFNEAGGKGQGENQKGNHRKGHSKKGYKSSHHKDETGSEESYYDEAHDEGDKFHYTGNEGSFGKKGETSYKGGHENGQFAADENRKQGHYDKQFIKDNANADKGQYGQKGYHGNSHGYSVNNGVGQQSLLGRQEANRLYYSQHPHGYIPIYDDSD